MEEIVLASTRVERCAQVWLVVPIPHLVSANLICVLSWLLLLTLGVLDLETLDTSDLLDESLAFR